MRSAAAHWTSWALVVATATGCAHAPEVFLSTTGRFNESQNAAVTLLERRGVVVKEVSIGVPAGVVSPVVIYGGDSHTERSARRLASLLAGHFGIQVPIRATSITNHRYSPGHIGIYLADSTTTESLNPAHGYVLSNEYQSQNCEDFQVTLWLLRNGNFRIEGTRYGVNAASTRVSAAGSYAVDGPILALLDEDERSVQFTRYDVQFSPEEPVKRTKWIPVSSATAESTVYNCAYLQELDALVRDFSGE